MSKSDYSLSGSKHKLQQKHDETKLTGSCCRSTPLSLVMALEAKRDALLKQIEEEEEGLKNGMERTDHKPEMEASWMLSLSLTNVNF